MTRIISNFAIRVRNLAVHEFPLLLAAVVAALSAVTGQSAKAYIVAAGIAALRFVVSPAFSQAAVQAKVIPPTVAELVAAQVEAALRAHEQAVPSVAPSVVAVDPLPVAPAPPAVDPAAPVAT